MRVSDMRPEPIVSSSSESVSKPTPSQERVARWLARNTSDEDERQRHQEDAGPPAAA